MATKIEHIAKAEEALTLARKTLNEGSASAASAWGAIAQTHAALATVTT